MVWIPQINESRPVFVNRHSFTIITAVQTKPVIWRVIVIVEEAQVLELNNGTIAGMISKNCAVISMCRIERFVE